MCGDLIVHRIPRDGVVFVSGFRLQDSPFCVGGQFTVADNEGRVFVDHFRFGINLVGLLNVVPEQISFRDTADLTIQNSFLWSGDGSIEFERVTATVQNCVLNGSDHHVIFSQPTFILGESKVCTRIGSGADVTLVDTVVRGTRYHNNFGLQGPPLPAVQMAGGLLTCLGNTFIAGGADRTGFPGVSPIVGTDGLIRADMFRLGHPVHFEGGPVLATIEEIVRDTLRVESLIPGGTASFLALNVNRSYWFLFGGLRGAQPTPWIPGLPFGQGDLHLDPATLFPVTFVETPFPRISWGIQVPVSAAIPYGTEIGFQSLLIPRDPGPCRLSTPAFAVTRP